RFPKNQPPGALFMQMFAGEPLEPFWALRNMSFSLLRGESLGVIGPNGAGKSSLLQVLAGIIQPAEGSVEVHGHVSSLLALGAGFDTELSGRENILLAGAFLGLPDGVVRELTPSITASPPPGRFTAPPRRTSSPP